MSEWKEYKLGDLCTSQNGYAFKSSSFRSQGKINVIKIKELKNGLVDFSEDTAKVEKQQELYKFIVNKGDIIFALTGDPITKSNPGSWVGRVSLYNHQEPAYLNQRVGKIICGADIDNLYLYYYFRWFPIFKTLASKAKGSASQANISLNDILETVIKLPTLFEQRRISSILSSLDDKIAVNKKICENLEAQAQALFKHWFVDFTPFKDGKFVESELGLIPEGWRVGKFSDIFDLGPGGTPKTSEKAYWENGTIPFFSPKDVNGVYCFETEKHITENGLNNCSSKLYEENTVFITCRGTVGKVAMTAVPMAMNQSNYAILSNKGYSKYFAYLVTVSIVKFLKFKANGAVFDAITTKDFNEQIIIPNTNIVSRFDSIIHPIFDEIHKIGFENLHLSTLRDTLLPKLMSGEIKVDDVK